MTERSTSSTAAHARGGVAFYTEVGLLAGLAILFAYALFAARDLGTDARIFPIFVGSLGVLFAVGSLVQLLLKPDAARGSDEETAEDEQAMPRGGLVFWVWLVIFCAAGWLFGFYVGIPVAAGAFTLSLAEGRRKGLIAGVGMGVFTWFYLYVVFAMWFQVPWFEGVLLQ